MWKNKKFIRSSCKKNCKSLWNVDIAILRKRVFNQVGVSITLSKLERIETKSSGKPLWTQQWNLTSHIKGEFVGQVINCQLWRETVRWAWVDVVERGGGCVSDNLFDEMENILLLKTWKFYMKIIKFNLWLRVTRTAFPFMYSFTWQLQRGTLKYQFYGGYVLCKDWERSTDWTISVSPTAVWGLRWRSG